MEPARGGAQNGFERKDRNVRNPLIPIAVHGAPRSGTTWLGEIFNSHPQVTYAFQPLFSYSLKGFLGEQPSAVRIEEFWNALEKSDDPFIQQAEKRENGHLPKFKKNTPSHLVYKEVRYHHLLPALMENSPWLRAVLIVRDPRAVISSWLRAPREFRVDMGWSIENEWRDAPSKNLSRPEEFNGFNRWKIATRIFLELKKTHPERIALIRYKDLLEEPQKVIGSIFQICSLAMHSQTVEFLNSGSGHNPSTPYGIDAKRHYDDGWKKWLDFSISQEISDELAGTDLAKFLD